MYGTTDVNKYLETCGNNETELDFFDDTDLISDEEPTAEALAKLAEESEETCSKKNYMYIGSIELPNLTMEQTKLFPYVKTYTDPNTGLVFPKLTREQRNSLKYTNMVFYQVRKQIYAFNKEIKTPLISGEEDFIICPHCHEKHFLKDMYLKDSEETLNAVDTIYYLSGGLYDFVTHCTGCNKFLYGYKSEPIVPEWLKECLSDLSSKNKKKSRKKTQSNESVSETPVFGEQLSLFDLEEFCVQTNSAVETSSNEVNTVTVSVENIPTIAEKMRSVANLNKELNIICDKVYEVPTYAEKIASFDCLKMKELINEAKARDGIQNFMRMNKREIISCLILFDDNGATEILFNNDGITKNSSELLQSLLSQVKERTAWLYGKYKNIT